MKKTEDADFVGLQGKSRCSFLEEPKLRLSDSLTLHCLSTRRSLFNTEGTDMEEQPLVRKKLLGKTLSITKAQFTLCRSFFVIWLFKFGSPPFLLCFLSLGHHEA